MNLFTIFTAVAGPIPRIIPEERYKRICPSVEGRTFSYEIKDYKSAYEHYLTSANLGDSWALNKLGESGTTDKIAPGTTGALEFDFKWNN